MKSYFVQLDINKNLFLKDPQQTKLGQKIIEHSVLLIDEIGLEQFTFRKLAEIIPSSEASIYRYFENKRHLFVYLLNWYWEWMIARIELNTLNINDPSIKLEVALSIIVDTANKNMTFEFVDENILHKIVVREGAKAYHHKLVDKDNDDGFFLAYKRLCNNIASIITEITEDFPYPRALASTLVETANNSLYYARHLPRLTDLSGDQNDQSINIQVKKMLEFFCFGLIHNNRQADKVIQKMQIKK
ncbi:MAG: AcrR family transcriptional regulator [Flavobacteriales bacterium]|jgi:AcrR family transcriptional regulator